MENQESEKPIVQVASGLNAGLGMENAVAIFREQWPPLKQALDRLRSAWRVFQEVPEENWTIEMTKERKDASKEVDTRTSKLIEDARWAYGAVVADNQEGSDNP